MAGDSGGDMANSDAPKESSETVEKNGSRSEATGRDMQNDGQNGAANDGTQDESVPSDPRRTSDKVASILMRPLDKGIHLSKHAVEATSYAVRSASHAVPSPKRQTRKPLGSADDEEAATTHDKDERKGETLAQKIVAGTKMVLIDSPIQAVKAVEHATTGCIAGSVNAVVQHTQRAPKVRESVRTDAAVSKDDVSSMSMVDSQALQNQESGTMMEGLSNTRVKGGSLWTNRQTVKAGTTAAETAPASKAGASILSDPPTTISGDDTMTIQMGPIYEFLLHDATIMLTLAAIVAAIPTFRNWDLILQNQIPFSVHIAWMMFVFQTGVEVGRLHGMRILPGAVLDKELDQKTESQLRQDIASDIGDSSTIPSMIAFPEKLKKHVPSYHEGYTLAIRLFEPVQKIRLRFGPGSFRTSRRGSWFGPLQTIVEGSRNAKEKVWSTLGASHFRERWEVSGFVKVTDPLMKRLLRNPDFRRKKLKEVVEEESKHQEESTNSAGETPSGRIGKFDLTKYEASSLEEDVIDPCFPLRGMDVWLTDAAEDDMASHPFLNKNGLRSKPTMLVNALVAWANVLIYFKLPDWFTDFDDIVENEDDPEDVKAVKRFLSGTDEYRDQRLKILPCLVEGPMPIKILAPPKKEMTIHCALLPTKWIKHARETLPDGTVREACLELEIDVMSNSPIRKISNMIRRYIKHISLDVAVVIEKPDKQNEPEPAACLALWRFDMIDVETCPPLPPRDVETEAYDSLRASSLVGLSEDQKSTLVAEEGGGKQLLTAAA